MDYEWLKDVLAVVATHGPWAVLSFYLVYKLLQRPHEDKESLEKIVNSYHEAVIDNAKITERLAILIEERTRRHIDNGSNGSTN